MACEELSVLERRAHERHELEVSAQAHARGAARACRTENLSEGGACLHFGRAAAPEVGDTVNLELELPGTPEPLQVEAEVRWRAGDGERCGVRFRHGWCAALAAFLATWMGATTADAAANASVPQFDPTAPVVLDMEAGGERPDDQGVLDAFERQYTQFDQCVSKAKRGKAKQLPGDVQVEVLLNPKGDRPLGINAKMPNGTKKKNSLKQCLRSAVAAAEYPSYDGPPVVVEFEFQLDPGEEWVEE